MMKFISGNKVFFCHPRFKWGFGIIATKPWIPDAGTPPVGGCLLENDILPSSFRNLGY